MDISIRSPRESCGAKVSFRQCLPRDEHITLDTIWMRDSDLIKDDNGVLHITVHTMHPEIGVIGLPPWAPLVWTVY